MVDSIIETDFLVVGGGIAGPALACALRDTEYRVVLLEKSDQPIDTARGDHLQPFTAEILERWGILDAFFNNGAQKRVGSIWYTSSGEELLDSSIAELNIPHPYFVFVNHETISKTFLDLAAANPNYQEIKPIRNWWLEDQSSQGSLIRVGMPDGANQHIRAKVLVGADGRNSRVRKTMEMTSDSHLYRCPIGVFFAKNHDKNQGNNVKAYVAANTIVSVIPRTGGYCKIGIPIEKKDVGLWRGASSEQLTQKLLDIVPSLRLSDVRFADVYPPIYLTTEHWVKDNVVLVGDACHAMHPARSQGMNVTIRCIDTLVRILKENDVRSTEASLVLKEYEASLKPTIDNILEHNHKKGLEFESMDANSYAELMESLKAVQANPAIRENYSLNAAGYL